mmetsp:Transcript_23150/g.42483  ORF Transcript_23150/g.42483 Transcript_23150/m.42483 type:complete len:288 (+) Transcript_23150:151-1014(+)
MKKEKKDTAHVAAFQSLTTQDLEYLLLGDGGNSNLLIGFGCHSDLDCGAHGSVGELFLLRFLLDGSVALRPHQAEQDRQQNHAVPQPQHDRQEELLEQHSEHVGLGAGQEQNRQKRRQAAVEDRGPHVSQARGDSLVAGAGLEHEAVAHVGCVVHAQANRDHRLDHGHVVDEQAPKVHAPQNVGHRHGDAHKHQPGGPRVANEQSRDDEHGHQAKQHVEEKLFLDDFERLPGLKLVRPGVGFGDRPVLILEFVHGFNRLVRIHLQAPLVVLGHRLELRRHAGPDNGR